MCVWNPDPKLEEVVESNIDELNELTDALILENIRLKEELTFKEIEAAELINRTIH